MMIHCRQDDNNPRTPSINIADIVIEGGENGNLTPVEEEKSNTEKTTTAVSDCTTPTAKEYKIPDVMTCPPAPRKRKVSLSVKRNRVRVVKQFFTSPELEVMLGMSSRVSSKISWSSRRFR
ncbi:hypothetical protein RCOM_1342750 [Ricinus communis]|uniref:Uncharacterized protein n=1 Tax=Ricinus communis TaxID=3988 RepID=B9RN24_RICCO|nr:hypothetical protein RCOM_1342750 [Ricinus communis]